MFSQSTFSYANIIILKYLNIWIHLHTFSFICIHVNSKFQNACAFIWIPNSLEYLTSNKLNEFANSCDFPIHWSSFERQDLFELNAYESSFESRSFELQMQMNSLEPHI